MSTQIICDRDNMVTVNGIPYYKELIGAKENKATGYEEPEKDERYWYKGTSYNIFEDTNLRWNSDYERIDSGNAFLDEDFAKIIARHDKLWSKIRKWQALNDEPLNVRKKDYKYFIGYSEDDVITTCSCLSREFTNGNAVLFSTEEKARDCIAKFQEELEWDAKNYKPRMDA